MQQILKKSFFLLCLKVKKHSLNKYLKPVFLCGLKRMHLEIAGAVFSLEKLRGSHVN